MRAFPPEPRPSGKIADLDIDFEAPDRPALVTRLLARDGDVGFWWAQTVSRRVAALVALSTERDALEIPARCVACNEVLEFAVPLSMLSEAADDDSLMAIALDNGTSVTLRRPTGQDLDTWRVARPASRDDAVRLMLDALLVNGKITAGAEAQLADTLAALDPLVAFRVTCCCPGCDAETQVEIDLEQLALDRLAVQQAALLHEVHTFASVYGWSETETLVVPPHRRARYLTLIEQGR